MEFGAVIFTIRLEQLTAFYEALLGATTVERSSDHVTLARGGLRLTIHRVPDPYAKQIAVTTPPTPREGSAVKLAFGVDSIDEARTVARRYGGDLRDDTWSSDERTLCEGYDFDGNVIQVWTITTRAG